MIQKHARTLPLLLILLFSACGKERLPADWRDIPSPTQHPLTDILFTDDSNGIITLGTGWQYGGVLRSSDGGATWLLDSLQDHQISALSNDTQGRLRMAGFVGYYAQSDGNGWAERRLPTYWQYRGIATYDGSRVALVSSGRITLLDGDTGGILSLDSLDNDLQSVAFADADNIVVAGYGQILHSADRGDSWDILPVTGDWFTDVAFPTSTVGYICGFNGSILKSHDAGATWDFLRRGDRITVPDKRFTALHFMDEKRGYLVGRNGLCWRTTDGGDSWQILKHLPDRDFIGVFVMEEGAFLISDDGGILWVEG